MAKKVTKTEFKKAAVVVKTYATQQAKIGAKKAHKNVKAAASSATKKVGSWFKNL